ncbi:MotA/TolQ/ExbB proton channel family protein [Verrucomicrobiaceae bacterium N1E253]|uniref:MotA/TolQ/ExbB proton channel family protein n=1 Tax=Oceaniferula marina TaxID=2748318 RepID=A0A851GFW2_9BACT|nr:MotA/TolQ/ExbB proton channel family protein [Oceaniferula marina]NWK56668.1 MotA/TolQ/ExbB proton channel family protein [Oceaniferula marina]
MKRKIKNHPIFLSASVMMLTVLQASAQTDAPISIEINWMEELQKGGLTGIALIVLAVAAVGFTIERLLNLRGNLIVSRKLIDEIKPLGRDHYFDEVRDRCAASPSVLSKVMTYVVNHRGNDPELYMAGAADIGAREIDKHRRKLAPIGIIASLAPLLGLLGTMIGMIEAFAKFALIEDSSEASIVLADSIGKALITTAMGLVIAIPTLVIYHYLRSRLNKYSEDLEEAVESLASAWFFQTSGFVKDTEPGKTVGVASEESSEDVQVTA